MSDSPKDDPVESDATVSGDSRVTDRVAESEWLRETSRAPGGKTSPAPAQRPAPPARATRIVVCDEGELDDVFDLLLRLDQNPLRVRPQDLEQLKEWERPSRLFVTTVRVGLGQAAKLPESVAGVVSIAIADSDARTLCTAMLRRGFRYVVRRPVHPEALRLLLMQVLYSGREQRAVARFPFGGEVRWRVGWRTGTCTVTEISAHGCRLQTTERFLLDAVVHLRVPAALSSSRDLRLRGRVVRRGVSDGDEGVRGRVAIRFEKLSARSRAHLDALLAERASGPAAQRAEGEAPAAPESDGSVRVSRLRLEDPMPAASVDPVTAPDRERRRRPRGAWHQEVLALDDENSQVLYTLRGSDLSTGGLRVEPHPVLRLGDDLKLALYDADHTDPIVLDARVVYDDGRRGWGLKFHDMPEDSAVRLEQMVASLPPVAALSEEEAKPEAVVMGEIRSIDSSRRKG